MTFEFELLYHSRIAVRINSFFFFQSFDAQFQGLREHESDRFIFYFVSNYLREFGRAFVFNKHGQTQIKPRN